MTIPLSIIWHQHQPFYRDLVSGEMVLPWVRLHGVKDYYGMARLISECPEMRCTINVVPSLLVQLIAYLEQNGSDPFLRRTLINADALSAEDAIFILDHFFMAQWDRMVRIYPRYAELLEMRRFGRATARAATAFYKVQDFRDLQVWFNLAWFHPVSFEESQGLRDLRKKGRDFTEGDKAFVLQEQRNVLAKVIPLHKELAARGQIELTTTPFYHPILPLLCDMRSCQVAMPNNPLPSGHVALLEDAETHVRKAVEYHRQVFGTPPQGMWPAEGSVSPDVVPIFARNGIRWIATDEEILAHSLGTKLRSGMGRIEHAELLYRPWQLESQGAKLTCCFRDHHLSDLIGFQYQSWDGDAAATDFLAQVQASAKDSPAGAETLASVILDGENCWEHYPEQGVAFLRGLYRRLEKTHGGITPVRVSDFLQEHPPTRKVEKLFSGSWINHDFYIWVGHSEDRRAWEYVYRTREDLVAATRARGDAAAQDPAITQAWEELYVAEGSDWYWWYGDDHTSGDDDTFDYIFRTHLINVYKFIGQMPPFFLSLPVRGGARAGRFSGPIASLQINVDGRCTNYFEWLAAGRYRADKEGGVMTAAGASMVEQIYFGYDAAALCLRIDIRDIASSDDPSKPERPVGSRIVRQLSVHFPELKQSFALEPLATGHRLLDGKWAPSAAASIEVAWDELVEMRIPFAALGVKEGQDLAFYVEVDAMGRASERYPRAWPLQLTVPSPNVREQEWMV